MGEELINKHRDTSLSIPASMKSRMAIDSARGMAYLHSRQIIHRYYCCLISSNLYSRDFKSPNLLVDNFYTVKVSIYVSIKSQKK